MEGFAFGVRARVAALLGAAAIALATGLATASAPAGAAVPEKTDIVFIFDTSGSMGGVLEEAKEQIDTLIANTKKSLPNVEFGVANVEDIPGYEDGAFVATKGETEYEEDHEKPWALWQPLTEDQAKVEEAVNNLSGSEVAHFGGDGPEAYGRALFETATNTRIGWRTGARHEIVLIADNVPHTPNVNENIPSQLWLANPFDTFEEPAGKFGIPGTTWKTGESLEFHRTLAKLDAEEKPLAMVNYFHTGESEEENYVHYWEYWAAATGGQAIQANEGAKSLDAKLEQIIKESAEGIPPCAPGFERTPTTPCVKKPEPAPTPAPTPAPKPLPAAAPGAKHVTVYVEDGEVEEEVELPEGGEAEFDVEVPEGAEAARFGVGPGQYIAISAKKSKKCKKGFVRKGKKCVNNAPILYGREKVTIPGPGRYKFKVRPSGRALTALEQGKTLHLRLRLTFTPAGTTTHYVSTSFVTVHLKKKHKKHKK
jgi:hypothetical protein